MDIAPHQILSVPVTIAQLLILTLVCFYMVVALRIIAALIIAGISFAIINTLVVLLTNTLHVKVNIVIRQIIGAIPPVVITLVKKFDSLIGNYYFSMR